MRKILDYASLYDAWKREKNNSELQRLHKKFYEELSKYIGAHREELQMLDENTLRAKLAADESVKIEELFKDLIRTRCKKILTVTFEEVHLPSDLLTSEEEAYYGDVLSVYEKSKRLERSILMGRRLKPNETRSGEGLKTVLIRFLQNTPAIIGSDTRAYGPFKAEDVASLPIENAESLIKHGIAVKVEIE